MLLRVTPTSPFGRKVRMAISHLGLSDRVEEVKADPADPADVVGDEPIWHGGAVVGWVTSGAYAHYSRRSLAFGYVPSELAVPGATFEMEIIGQRRPARLLPEPVLDPAGQRMRV